MQATKKMSTSAHLPAPATHSPSIFAALAAERSAAERSGPPLPEEPTHLKGSGSPNHGRSASSRPLRAGSKDVPRAPTGLDLLGRMAQRRNPRLPDSGIDDSAVAPPETPGSLSILIAKSFTHEL